MTVSFLFFRHRDLLHFGEKGNRLISKNCIQAHLELNSQCCINGCHFLPGLVPADTGLQHPRVHQSCSSTPASSKIHPRVQSETKWFFNCCFSQCSQGSITNAVLQIWNLKNHVVNEISARNRLTSSCEPADGSLKNSVHFRGLCNFLIIWGPKLAATLRSIDFLNYQHCPLLNHVLPASNFLSILKT